jgi:Gamma tubulin complex component N-terminal
LRIIPIISLKTVIFGVQHLSYLSISVRRDLLDSVFILNLSSLEEASLRDLIERMLPLATYYTGIAAFIEFRSHTDYGLVNHALCAATRDMLKVKDTRLSFVIRTLLTVPIGLPYPDISARTRVCLVFNLHVAEIVVLRPSYPSHPLYLVCPDHGAGACRRSRAWKRRERRR